MSSQAPGDAAWVLVRAVMARRRQTGAFQEALTTLRKRLPHDGKRKTKPPGLSGDPGNLAESRGLCAGAGIAARLRGEATPAGCSFRFSGRRATGQRRYRPHPADSDCPLHPNHAHWAVLSHHGGIWLAGNQPQYSSVHGDGATARGALRERDEREPTSGSSMPGQILPS